MILLESALDYAGLFPPASLGMTDAVRCYDAYRRSAERALLGRFVVPVGRLDELAAAIDGVGVRADGWEFSVIGAGDPREDSQRIADLEARHAHGGPFLSVRSIERKADDGAEIEHFARGYHDAGGRSLYLELPITAAALPDLVDAVGRAGAYAKVRTGGTTSEGFPRSAAVARFVAVCASAEVPFKATAGLHHALRGDYPLDGRPDSKCARMHGFLNLFVGAVLFDSGRIGEEQLSAILEESTPHAFDFADDWVRWRGHEAGPGKVHRARERLLHSFGTCEFEEPVRELARVVGRAA